MNTLFDRFLTAVKEGNLPLVMQCLDAGVPVDVAGDFGRTALHEAAAEGHFQILARLLDSGADPNAACSDGWTPSCEAARNNQTEALKLLLNRGADPVLPNPWSVFEAALRSSADVSVFHELLSFLDPNTLDRDGCPIIQLAILKKRADVVSLLLRSGASDQVNVNGECPLLNLALDGSRDDVFQVMFERVVRKVSPESLTDVLSLAADRPGKVALENIGHLLLAGADPHGPDRSGVSLIQKVCICGQEELLYFLMRETTVTSAAFGWIESGAFLAVRRAEAEFFAGHGGQGPRPLHRWDPPLDKTLRPYLNMIEAIQKCHPLPSSAGLLMASLLGSRSDLFQDLLTKGTDVNQLDPDGRCPLVEAVGRWEKAQFRDALLSSGADVNRQDGTGCTPLLAAAWVDEGMYRDEVPTVKLLLANGADPDIADNVGCTPLMKAKEHNGYIIAEILIAAGCRGIGIEVNQRFGRR